MRLLVDDRIGSREFLKPLGKMGCPVVLKRLDYADFAWRGYGPDGLTRVGVERKTVSEMLAAVTDSRFAGRQLPGLLKTYSYVYLLVEGIAHVDRHSGLLMSGKYEAGWGRTRHTYENYRKYLTTLSTKAGLRIVHTVSPTETAHCLHALHSWWSKRWTAHKSAYHVEEHKPDAAIFDERTFRRQTFAQWPLVGWERSRKVSAYFPSIAAAVNASEDEWMQALGIRQGRLTVRKLRAMLHGKDQGHAKGS